jgi:hypothetical protein
MTILLIANVGNRDVWVQKDAPIPGEAHPLWNPGASRRALGKVLWQNWAKCRSHVTLPIIGKAVDYVLQQEGRIDHLILISSDQSASNDVSERHLAQDTCKLAPVVKRFLEEMYDLNGDDVVSWKVRDNPADYGGMGAFYRQQLPRLRERYDDATFYLEVSGGTPAMTSMLLTVGADVFGIDARPLYVSEHEEKPFPLDLGRRTVAKSLKDVVRENVSIYAYHAAAHTVRDNLELLREFAPADTLLIVLEYARQRINFNFDQAREMLVALPGNERATQLENLTNDLHPDQIWWLLHEIVHNAEIRLEVGAYGDFLVRLFRFDEAVRRHTALKLGARLVDRDGETDADGEFVDPDWLDENPDLLAYLQEKKVRIGSDIRIRANRFVLLLVFTFLVRREGGAKMHALRKRLNKLDQLSDVRNKSFAVHTFDGVTRERMVHAFLGQAERLDLDVEQGIDEIVETVREACRLATGRFLEKPGPYDRVNALILDLLKD